MTALEGPCSSVLIPWNKRFLAYVFLLEQSGFLSLNINFMHIAHIKRLRLFR